MNLPDVPPSDDITTDWWEATREHRLTVQRCSACDGAQHPPRAVCIQCGATDHLGQAPSSGVGAIDSWTVVHRAPRSGIETPYVVARVRLAEGPIVLTRIETDGIEGDGQIAIGDSVEVAWWDLPDGRALPIFRPISSSSYPT